MVPLSAGDEVGGKGGPASPSATGLEGIGGDCIAKSSSPRSKAAMSEVLTLEDFSLAKALKLYPTLKEQLLVDNGLTEKQEEEKQPLLCQQQQLQGKTTAVSRPVTGEYSGRKTNIKFYNSKGS